MASNFFLFGRFILPAVPVGRPHPEFFPHHCPRIRPDRPRQISRILCPAKKSRLRLRDIVSQGRTSVAMARSPKLWVFSAAGNCGVLRMAPFRREESLRQLFQVFVFSSSSFNSSRFAV